MILKGESAEEFNMKADENYEKFKARQKQNTEIIEQQQTKTKMSKPPIGLKPKKYHSLERLNEVRSAIARYYDAELPIPIEWVEEYNKIINQKEDE